MDKAFISAPENFRGTMRVVATLYSASHEILETNAIRFEWRIPEEVERTVSTDPAAGAAGTPSATGADEAAQARFSDAFGSRTREDDAHATSEHAEPSTHGPRPLWLTMVVDWSFQISSISLPATDRPFERPVESQRSKASNPAGLAERGLRLLREGKIRAARSLLRRATDAGNADAAIALARTFDPLFFQTVNPDRATANPAEAARWYRRGLQLGRKDVSTDLERVAGMIRITPPPPRRDGPFSDPTPRPTE
jgi:TPR repeat protein